MKKKKISTNQPHGCRSYTFFLWLRKGGNPQVKHFTINEEFFANPPTRRKIVFYGDDNPFHIENKLSKNRRDNHTQLSKGIMLHSYIYVTYIWHAMIMAIYPFPTIDMVLKNMGKFLL